MIDRRARDRGWQFQFEQIALAGQVAGTGLRQEALALFEQVGDVFAGVGGEFVRVVHRPAQRLVPVDLGQSDDFRDMVPHIEATRGELRVIHGSVVMETGANSSAQNGRKKAPRAGRGSWNIDARRRYSSVTECW
jgi:hypothetical protein